jgi:hypothetical protein
MTHHRRLSARPPASLAGGALLLLASAASAPAFAQPVPTDFTAIVRHLFVAVTA